MLPILFSLGPITFRTLNLFLVLAFLGVAFFYWRKGREEHYDESQLFDGFLLSSLYGFLIGRIGFIILQFAEFGLRPLLWLDIFSHPGVNLFIGMVGAGIYLYWFALQQRWDEFEITDFWVQALSFGLGIIWLGLFFDGSSFGFPTSLPWGIVFPGVFEKHQPLQLYFAIFYLLQFWYLARSEYHYRTYSWYRAGHNTAQTGFLTSLFIAQTGLFSLLMSFLAPGQFVVYGVVFDSLIYFLMMLAGIALLFIRSGRTLPRLGSKK